MGTYLLFIIEPRLPFVFFISKQRNVLFKNKLLWENKVKKVGLQNLLIGGTPPMTKSP